MRQTTLPGALMLLLSAGYATLLAGCASTDPGSVGASPTMSGQATVTAGPPRPASPATWAPATPPAGPSTTAATRRPAPAPSGTRAVPVDATVVVTRSGGFAGRTETITVRPDGQWTRDGSGSQPGGRLTAAERTRLRTLLGDPRLGGESGVYLRQGCADTFRWTLTAGPVKVSYDECLAPADRPPATVAVVTYVVEAAA